MLATEKSHPPCLNVEWIRDKDRWKHLESEWNELLQDSAADAVFLSWDWLDTWLEVYGDGGEWVILTARGQDGQLMGVAPMMLDRGRGKVGRWISRLILVGQKADTASEYLDWILRRGREATVVQAFCHFIFCDLSKWWDVIQFDSMRSDAVSIPLIADFCLSQKVFVAVTPTSTAPYLTLPETWEVFMGQQRGKFRQRWNKFQRDHKVVVKVAGKDLTVSEGMAVIQDLNERRWGERRRSFLSDRYREFHEKVSLRLGDRGHLLMLFLEVDGVIVAGRYDFAYGGKGWSFQSGWSTEWEHISIGKLMLTQVVKSSIEAGLTEYDFLGGEADYKTEWANGERGLSSLSGVNGKSVRGRLFDILKRIRNWWRKSQPSPELCPAASKRP